MKLSPFTVMLEPELIDGLAAIRAAERRTVSGVVELALEEFLKGKIPQPPGQQPTKGKILRHYRFSKALTDKLAAKAKEGYTKSWLVEQAIKERLKHG